MALSVMWFVRLQVKDKNEGKSKCVIEISDGIFVGAKSFLRQYLGFIAFSQGNGDVKLNGKARELCKDSHPYKIAGKKSSLGSGGSSGGGEGGGGENGEGPGSGGSGGLGGSGSSGGDSKAKESGTGGSASGGDNGQGQKAKAFWQIIAQQQHQTQEDKKGC